MTEHPPPPAPSEGMDLPLSLTGSLNQPMKHNPPHSIMGSYQTNPYIQAGVYSSFKAMEMIQGIFGFENFNSGILEGGGGQGRI